MTSLKARFDTEVTLRARFDTEVTLRAQVDRFTESGIFTYSLDFSDSRNSFYLCLF